MLPQECDLIKYVRLRNTSNPDAIIWEHSDNYYTRLFVAIFVICIVEGVVLIIIRLLLSYMYEQYYTYYYAN